MLLLMPGTIYCSYTILLGTLGQKPTIWTKSSQQLENFCGLKIKSSQVSIIGTICRLRFLYK
jgi:hypothetical protein